ncbi:hypothetical protein H2203_005116 [Taxawa tesnikishii (nom. ined.)]|nr:hypothetical protein H2203_005116 [Dothideales sp. JES 119]
MLTADRLSGQSWSLHTLLLETMALKASEIKDHLFALRALVAEVDRPALYGSYADKDFDIFRRLTLHLLQQMPPTQAWPRMSPSWTLAVAAAQNCHDVTKPSWILDYSNAHRPWVPPEYYVTKSDSRSHRVGANWAPEDPLALRLSGLQIATITSTMRDIQSSTDTLPTDDCHTATHKTIGEVAGKTPNDEALYKLCLRFCYSRRTNGMAPKGPLADIFFAQTDEDVIRLCNHQISHNRHREAHTNWAAYTILHLKGVRPQQRWFRWHEPRQNSLAHLSDGRLGWVPSMTLVGDSVVLLQGAPRPFVVRRMSQNSLRLVGDAEIPGLKIREIAAGHGPRMEELRII